MTGFSVSGGGSVEVDTAPMLAAAAALARAGNDLRSILVGLGAVRATAAVGAAVHAAEDHARAALRCCERAADGLRLAGIRYGLAEEAATSTVQSVAAAEAALAATGVRLAAALGPVPPLLLLATGTAAAGEALLVVAGAQAISTGRVAPQLDPAALWAARVALASADDAARGLLGVERPWDVLTDDPAAMLGSESIAAGLAAVVPRDPGGVVVRPVFRALPAPAPASLGELADRVPHAEAGEPQIRIERYGDPHGRRWIVYVTGTVTFAPNGRNEPFDMRSNLLGAADRPSPSEAAVTTAMRAAGVGPEEPVLLVGHSQGALDAVRIAQHGDYRVAGVVTLGGPTGQIALPSSVPVLAIEHEEDPVPVLVGAPASGSAGRARIVVRRRLYDRTHPPPALGVPSHALKRYAETLHEVERSPEPRLVAFQRRIAPFLAPRTGADTAYRAERTGGTRPSRARPAGGAPDR